MSTTNKPQVSMRIRLRYPDVETFVAKYAANISEGGMFIQSRAPQAVGTGLRFDLMLQDGTPLLKGEGTVIWVKEYDAAHPSRVHGMGVRFGLLDDTSHAMVERIVSWKRQTSAPAVKLSATQEVRALVPQAISGEIEELDAEVPSEPSPRALPDDKPTTLFAAFLDEARQEGDAPSMLKPDQASGRPPLAASPSAGQATVFMPTTFSDGVAVAVEMAEQVLRDLLLQSGINEEQVQRAWRWASEVNALEATAELEHLLPEGVLPIVDFDVNASPALRAPALVVPAATAPAEAAVPDQKTSVEPAREEVPAGDSFDPALLQAAARTARASKAVTGHAFDLSDDQSHQAERANGVFEPRGREGEAEAEAPDEAALETPPDAGWARLQTGTELLDHGSSSVLKDLAQRSRASAFSPGESASLGTENEASHVREAPPPTGAKPAIRLQSTPGLGEARGIHPAHDDDVVPLEPPPSTEALAQEVWREVVAEVAEDQEDGTGSISTDLEAFFEPPVAHETASEDTDVLSAATLDLDPMDSFGAPDDESKKTAAKPDTDTFSDILSDLGRDLVEKLGGNEEDLTQVTADSFAESAQILPADSFRRDSLDEPDLDDLDSPTRDTSPQAKDPLAEFDSEPFDRAEEVLRADPALEDEVFEALAGLRDTLRDDQQTGLSRANAGDEDVPDLDDLLVRTGIQPARPGRAPSQETTSLDHDTAVENADPADPDGPKRLRPRKSGILKRLFGKKEP